jgi:hypothetical protein
MLSESTIPPLPPAPLCCFPLGAGAPGVCVLAGTGTSERDPPPPDPQLCGGRVGRSDGRLARSSFARAGRGVPWPGGAGDIAAGGAGETRRAMLLPCCCHPPPLHKANATKAATAKQMRQKAAAAKQMRQKGNKRTRTLARQGGLSSNARTPPTPPLKSQRSSCQPPSDPIAVLCRHARHSRPSNGNRSGQLLPHLHRGHSSPRRGGL